MQKTIKKTIALLLTVVMLLSLGIPMVGAVEATTATYPTYAEAADGELLYKVDFRDKTRYNYDESSTVVGGDYTASEDGSALTIRGDGSLSTKNQYTVGGAISDLPLNETSVYTIDFSITTPDSSYSTYFSLAPDLDNSHKGRKGDYGFLCRTTYVQIESNFSPTGTKANFENPHTEAVADGNKIQFRIVVHGKSSADGVDFYYLNNSNAWVKALTAKGFNPNVDTLNLYFANYSPNVNVVLSDVSIYKGDLGTTFSKGNLGEPLYELNFNNEQFNYSVCGTTLGDITTLDNGTALKIRGKTGASTAKTFTIGGELAGLPLNDTSVYTIDFDVTMAGNANTTYLGLAPAFKDGNVDRKGTYAFVLRTNYVQLENTFSNAGNSSKVNFVNPAAEQTDAGIKVSFRIVVNAVTDTVDFYYLNTNSQWVKAQTGEGFTPNIEKLNMYFSVYNENEDAVLSNVKIYGETRYVEVIDGDTSEYLTLEKNITEYTLPTATKEGNMFCGWKVNGSEDIIKSGTTVSTKNLYSVEKVFVPVMSEIWWQAAKIYDGETDTGKRDVRFVSAIDSLDYKSIGYDVTITYGGNSYDNNNFDLKHVYSSLLASYGAEIVTLETLGYDGTNGGYITAFVIKNVPNSVGDITVELTPYQVTTDGTKVTGEAISVTLTAENLNK